jgi:peptidoglycan/LPS O-acetylase OafA/YrhL
VRCTARRAVRRTTSAGGGPPIDNEKGRIEAYDLARSFAILFTFLGHAVITHTSRYWLDRFFATLSPGLTMSLLGFVSAALLAGRDSDSGGFLVKRLARIYVPLIVCLCAVLAMQAVIGTARINDHTALHFMGLSWIFSLLSVANKSSVGSGLWFVTVILAMYLLLPVLRRVFRHKRGLLHLIIIVALSIFINRRVEVGDENWNVVIAFCVGTYLTVSGTMEALLRRPVWLWALLAAALLGICAVATVGVIPFRTRSLLFPFYPVVFVPLFFALARHLPQTVTRVATLFALVSYEFYILQFYFIGTALVALAGASFSLPVAVALGFALTLMSACILYWPDSWLRARVERYLLAVPRPRP